MRRLLPFAEDAAALSLLLVALLTAGNVALRDLLGVQIPDWFDLSKQLQAIALFWGIAVATRRGSHICVDVAWERCSARGRRRLDLLATALVALSLAPLAWMVWVKVAGAGTQTTSDLRIPLVPFLALSAAGATAAFLLALVRCWDLRSDEAARVAEDANRAEGDHG